MQFQKFRPSAPLENLVRFFYSIQGPEGTSSSIILNNNPQGEVDLIFTVGDGINFTGGDKQEKDLGGIFLIAQQKSHFTIKFSRKTHVIGAAFYAEAFSHFFNFPLHEITDGAAEVTDELTKPYRSLLDQFKNTPQAKTQIEILDKFLSKRIVNGDYNPSSFDQLMIFLRKQKGMMSIEELADMANMSRRTLERKSKDTLGLGLKSYSRVIRFKYAMSLLALDKKVDWQDILYQCGYYDQMHFIKDFKHFTGQTPTQFLKDNTSLTDFFNE